MRVQQCLHQQHGKYIFSVQYHIFFYTIGVFYSDKVNKILDRIKFKRKNKIKKGEEK